MSLRSTAQLVKKNYSLPLEGFKEDIEFRDRLTCILAEAQDLADVVDQIFKAVIEFSGAFGGIFRLANERAGTLDAYQSIGLPTSLVEKVKSRHFGEGLAGFCAQSGETISFSVKEGMGYGGELVAMGVRSILALPLRAKEHVIAVLEIFTRSERGFDESLVNTLTSVSRQIGIALESISLVENLESRMVQRNRLYRLMLKLQSSVSLDELLSEIVNILSDIYAPAYSVIVLYDSDDQVLRVKAASKSFLEEVAHKEIPLGIGITGHAAKSRSALLINDAPHDPRYIKGVHEVSSELAVPMVAEGKLIGVLDLESPLMNAFKEEDLRLLTIYAQQAAMAISKAQLFEQACEQNLAKSRMVSALSHELRTPLAVIKSYAWFLKNNPNMTRGEENEQLDVILTEVDNLNELIENLLNLARLEQGKMEWNAVSFDIVVLIQDLLDSLAKVASERQIKLILSSKGSAIAWGDVSRWRQALLNIMSNALKYNKDNGIVSVSIDDSGQDYVCVCIEDTGIGIRPQDLERIFVPFYRVPGSSVEGIGLGLAVTKQFVEAQRGRIEVESEHEKGSKFFVYIPKRGRS